jgi:RNA polymerase sigma-70 factor (ECF subfamily)
MPDKPSPTSQADALRRFVADQHETLVSTLRLFLLKANLPAAEDSAHELLNEVVLEALQHADRFDRTRQAMAWLLGIAANLIRRRQLDTARRDYREPLIRDLYGAHEHTLSDDELFDRLLPHAHVNEPEPSESPLKLIDRLSASDQQVLQLAMINELDGAALARALNVAPGTARVRLHRAIQRLRVIWQASQREEQL